MDRIARADRILDVTKDLLLRWGYPRVTIDEIAKRAGVGKGTVYLHWRSRDELFHAISARETVSLIDAMMAGLRDDPLEVTLHRHVHRFYLEVMRLPVLRALHTRDSEIVGDLLSSPCGEPLEKARLAAVRRYLDILSDHGMLREGLRPEDLHYSLPSILFGFISLESVFHRPADLALEDRADQLSETLRRAFEPPTAPPRTRCAATAAEAIGIFMRLREFYWTTAYGDVASAGQRQAPQDTA